MNNLIDLHTHSTASDGSMSPRELIRHAKEKGLKAIALTDHDTIDGIPDALDEGKRQEIEVIPGVEISVDYMPEMHMLGYFSKSSYVNMADVLADLRKNREQRNPKIIRKLNELGFDITLDEANAEAKGNVMGRPHIAMVLIKKGYVKSMEEAFNKYLGNDRPAYFKKDKLIPAEGIKEITNAGGIPVIAHPVLLGIGFKRLDELLLELVPYGLKGIEAYYVENTKDDTGNLLRLAIKHQILATGGSDFHGGFKTNIEIGRGHGNLKVPYELLDKLKELLNSN
jgi:3',5'-nucleoside bisphosphate phosphatase